MHSVETSASVVNGAEFGSSVLKSGWELDDGVDRLFKAASTVPRSALGIALCVGTLAVSNEMMSVLADAVKADRVGLVVVTSVVVVVVVSLASVEEASKVGAASVVVVVV